MAHNERTYPWSNWPPASQQRLFKMVLLGLAGAFFSVFVGVYLFTSTLEQQIVAEKEQYARVMPIVQGIHALRAKQGDLARLTVKDATWRIIDERMLESRLTSIRSTGLNDSNDAVQVTFTGVTLIMLTDFLQDLRDRASLQTPEFTLTRNNDDPRLADVHLVLSR
ncbi:hypothetical protein GO013_11090 [Pseudodesulfovibrio sp. JC047]|uniref:type II secretion system protein GspM n=1 Tax=Pseudodesulfovibrio sp. JC047 TaxID=2683199 RepID=UPI0013D4FF61|nr:type II secretion system protein GspM [Pseudodesulfovibrio sp. JC047]NDV19966.1 hypothetical protein [Pseudodesulfovibrio sp. JC047]